MHIIVNGETLSTEHSHLPSLLHNLGYDGKAYVVELNGRIISKDNYETTVLSAADRLEIVSFVGGG